MEFNKITRGAKRQANSETQVFEILDAGFLCQVGFVHAGRAMIIPTAYGRFQDFLYLHGSAKNFMLNEAVANPSVCISVTHVDGLVLARNLFHSSVNYRSVVLFGPAQVVTNKEERVAGLKIITEQIIKGRSYEVPVGSEQELKATLVVKFKIETASAKVRTGGPQGDEEEPGGMWSGVLPLVTRALAPQPDEKFDEMPEPGSSVANFLIRYNQ